MKVITFIKEDSNLVHWTKWQPDALQQMSVESRMLYTFMYGVKIKGFKKRYWPVVKVDGIELTINGRNVKEGDSISDLFIPNSAKYSDINISFVTQIGDKDLEKWTEIVLKTMSFQYNYRELPTHFQPSELEYANGIRRDIAVHYLNLNKESERIVLLKKAMPISHSLVSLEPMTSNYVITNVKFNVKSIQHNV